MPCRKRARDGRLLLHLVWLTAERMERRAGGGVAGKELCCLIVGHGKNFVGHGVLNFDVSLLMELELEMLEI